VSGILAVLRNHNYTVICCCFFSSPPFNIALQLMSSELCASFSARSQHTRDPCTARICSSAIQFNATQTDTNQRHCQLPARCVGKDKTCRYMWAYPFCLCYQFLIEASNFKLYTYSWSVELYFFLYFFIPSCPFPLSLYPALFFLARLIVSPWR